MLFSFQKALAEGVILSSFAHKSKQAVPILFINCTILDPINGAHNDDCAVLVLDGIIQSIMEGITSLPHGKPHHVIDCGGRVLMPGLCDAHVHCTASSTANLAALLSLPESYVSCWAAKSLKDMLMRGFTTVRDAGGADFGLAQAVEEGLLVGPRLLFTGHALSQTGGHGDFRCAGEQHFACGAALRGIGRVCDGDSEVRRAARDELRKGAHCIKIMASGGVSSPTDRLTNRQFSTSELKAIVEEAAACDTYVCAHAYTPASIARAVECGVRSIEHGNYLDEPTARLMAEKGAFLVPTLVTYAKLAEEGISSGMLPELVAKVGDTFQKGMEAVQLAEKHGITMCYGSDLLGDMQRHQSAEFEIRQRVLPPARILQAATVNCAALFMMEDKIGQVKAGMFADLLVVNGDPLTNPAVLTDSNNVLLVMKGGVVAKAPEHAWDGVNDVKGI